MKVNRYALKDFMENEGLRLTDLAEKSGVSKGFLSELLSGTKNEASAATLKKLADVIGCRVRALAQNPDGDDEVAELDEQPAPTPDRSSKAPRAPAPVGGGAAKATKAARR